MAEIRQCFLTQNDCYTEARPMTPRGIVLHSTGANNPTLRRYVQPDDGDIGQNPYGNDWNRTGLEVCVHAFIGKDKTGTVRCYQTLPWTTAAWGVGRGDKGSYNYDPTGHIQMEICEDALDDEAYFEEAFALAEAVCAELCRRFSLPAGAVVSHREAALAGYASAHGDPDHWLAAFGRDMDGFRRGVQERLQTAAPVPEEALGQRVERLEQKVRTLTAALGVVGAVCCKAEEDTR